MDTEFLAVQIIYNRSREIETVFAENSIPNQAQMLKIFP